MTKQDAFNNDQFNACRMDAGITSAQFADFVGISRKSAYAIERCMEPVGDWAFAALAAMIKEGASA